MATELQVFVLVRVTANAPRVRASPVQITFTRTSTHTGITVNAD